MKRSRLTDEQITFALKLAETGTKVSEVCLKMGEVQSILLHNMIMD